MALAAKASERAKVQSLLGRTFDAPACRQYDISKSRSRCLCAGPQPRLPAVVTATLATAVGLLAVVAMAASWIPAYRASAIDPFIALYQE